MKKRDVILDFTSLLDVTLIVIFFFILFSHMDSQENKARTDEKVYELETAIQEAEERKQVADKLAIQLEEEIAIVRRASERQASNINEMLEYNRSENVKIILDMNSASWSVRIIHGGEAISTVYGGDAMGAELISVFKTIGYDNSKTIFCDFIFDGSLPGTASAYRKIKKGLDDVSDEYSYLYISETDLSIGGE